jgi:hypothetical protein
LSAWKASRDKPSAVKTNGQEPGRQSALPELGEDDPRIKAIRLVQQIHIVFCESAAPLRRTRSGTGGAGADAPGRIRTGQIACNRKEIKIERDTLNKGAGLSLRFACSEICTPDPTLIAAWAIKALNQQSPARGQSGWFPDAKAASSRASQAGSRAGEWAGPRQAAAAEA